MRCQTPRYPDTKLLVQLARKRVQFRLVSLYKPTWQVPHVRVGTLVRPPMHEQNPASRDERADDDLMHPATKPRSSDKRYSPVRCRGADRVSSGIPYAIPLGFD